MRLHRALVAAVMPREMARAGLNRDLLVSEEMLGIREGVVLLASEHSERWAWLEIRAV